MPIIQEPLFRKLIVLLMSTLLFFVGLFSPKAQSPDSTFQNQPIETLLKIEHDTSPFNYGQRTWINNRGFNTTYYDWSDPEINLLLDKAIVGRNTSRVFLIAGAVLQFIGYASLMSGVATGKNASSPAETVYVTGTIMFYGSFLINLSARQKVKKAHLMRIKNILK